MQKQGDSMKINIVGTAQKTYQPQIICLNVTFAQFGKDYEQAFAEGKKALNEFLLFMQNLNFDIDTFKTISFGISENFDYKKESLVKNGFNYRRVLKIEFDYNIERLKKILSGISKLNNKPVVNVKFDLKDINQKKQEVLLQAFEDAKNQALMLSKTANTVLKVCTSITDTDYSDDYSVNSEITVHDNHQALTFSDEEIDFIPDDIVVSKTVKCIFEAKYILADPENSQKIIGLDEFMENQNKQK